MGLDNYFLVKIAGEEGQDESWELEPCPIDINLVGGMMSGNGQCGSFRGKYYSPLVDYILDGNRWLYQDRNLSEIKAAFTKMEPLLETITDDGSLKEYLEDTSIEDYGYSAEDVIGLVKMFQYYATKCGNNTLKLRAWY